MSDYLYNIEPGIAEVFIKNNLKEHFNFKVGDIKPLPGYQRDIFKEFSEFRESSRKQEKPADVPEWYDVSDKGKWTFLPGALADHLIKHEDAFFCAEQYYFYEGGVYRAKNEKCARKRVRSFTNTRYIKYSEIVDAESQWQISVDKTVREININPYILNYENGLYNMMEDELTPHTPKYLSTIRLGGNHDPTAECPIFLKYLLDVLPESELPLIQEILGYMCVPINRAQKPFVIVGAGDSGKSTFLSVVQEVLLGEENVSTLTWQDLDEKFATVQLFGKLANVFADLPSETIRDTGTFKAITGEDWISAQHKFKDYFSFKPFCRLLFSCNTIPKNYTDRSDGFYRRLILIRFDRTIPEDQRDPHLLDKLKLERDGILAWALIGLKRLVENNYRFSETDRTKAELRRYRMDNNNVLAFIEDCCTTGPDFVCYREDLYREYVEYCGLSNQRPMSRKRFNEIMEMPDSGVVRGQDSLNGRKTWKGIMRT